jgi:transposase InsO family protein
MSSPSIGGKYRYYISFIDDFSRKTWIYFLKGKTSEEVLRKFQEFKVLVENQSGKKIKVLRSDNGGEYTSHAFKKFCAGAGIKRELTVPYTPQQNGVSERKNRAIVGATKAMLHDQDLPKFLWARSLQYCSLPPKSESSQSAWKRNSRRSLHHSWRKPDIRHLRIFGCVVYCHIPKQRN